MKISIKLATIIILTNLFSTFDSRTIKSIALAGGRKYLGYINLCSLAGLVIFALFFQL
jgi:hypothetical protein